MRFYAEDIKDPGAQEAASRLCDLTADWLRGKCDRPDENLVWDCLRSRSIVAVRVGVTAATLLAATHEDPAQCLLSWFRGSPAGARATFAIDVWRERLVPVAAAASLLAEALSDQRSRRVRECAADAIKLMQGSYWTVDDLLDL